MKTTLQTTKEELDRELASIGYKINEKMSFNSRPGDILTRICYIVERNSGLHWLHNQARTDGNQYKLRMTIRRNHFLIKGKVHELH